MKIILKTAGFFSPALLRGHHILCGNPDNILGILADGRQRLAFAVCIAGEVSFPDEIFPWSGIIWFLFQEYRIIQGDGGCRSQGRIT